MMTLAEIPDDELVGVELLNPTPVAGLFREILDQLDGLKDKLDEVENRLNNVEKICLQSWNLVAEGRSKDGLPISWRVIPFSNGDIPTSEPHNLPALHSSTDVKNLTEEELTSYIAGYGIFVPIGVIDRAHVLCKWIVGRYLAHVHTWPGTSEVQRLSQEAEGLKLKPRV